MSKRKTVLLILGVVLADQLIKFYVKTNFVLGESYDLLPWFKLFFVENEGMAWGTTLSDIVPFISNRSAKLTLTIFRILAIAGIGYWLYSVLESKRSQKNIALAIALIFAGALGNIIDSVFYGLWFDSSLGSVANFLPEQGGYDNLFYGQVVDMFYLPIWKGFLPEWVPFYGGDYFTFFEPVFNLADVAISFGFLFIIRFYKFNIK